MCLSTDIRSSDTGLVISERLTSFCRVDARFCLIAYKSSPILFFKKFVLEAILADNLTDVCDFHRISDRSLYILIKKLSRTSVI